jgi:hypothetical protein
MSQWKQYEFLLYGIIISLIIILIWIGYARWYRTSIERLSHLASKKYQLISSATENAKYIVQADPNLSSIDPTTGKFKAIITRKPDMNNPDAAVLSNVIMFFDIVYKDCDEKTDPVKFMTCINVN